MLLLFFSGRANNRAFPTGVQATGLTGAVDISTQANVFIPGVFATGMVGSVVVPQPMSISATGVQALGVVSGAIVWGRIMPWSNVPGGPSDIWTEIVPKKLF
jgi:hypothetical protein